MGIGTAFYEARKELIRERGLKRLLTGGRIAGYSAVADELTPKEYVAEVVDGKRRDPALSFQLENDLVVLDVVPGYMNDVESRGFATVLEWLNPEYTSSVSLQASLQHAALEQAAAEAMRGTPRPRRVRIAAVARQHACGDAVIGINPVSDNLNTLETLLHMLDRIIGRYRIPTQSCVLAHVTTQMEALRRGAPVDLLASDKVMLQFYTSGVRDASEVHVRIAGQDVPVLYSGASGHFAGLDEVIVELPRSLAGMGRVDVVLTADGQTAGPVSIHIQ